ncbi:MAG: hypothetical protein WKG32_13150, partial [Gemmatimonadaceae bacterium]
MSVVVLTVVAVAAMATLGIGSARAPRRTSGTAPSLDGVNVVAVLPFFLRGDTTHAYLREGLADLLSVGLDGLGGLRTVDPYALFAAVARTADAPLDPAHGRALAARFDAGLYVLGEVMESGGRLHAIASLYDARGALSARAEASGRADGDVTELADSLTRRLVAGRYRGPADELTRIAVLTTSSVPALRAYLQGEQALRAGRFDAAVMAFQDAVAADSDFALAYYRLGVAAEWEQLGDLNVASSEHAARLGHRLSPRTRMLLEASRVHRSGDAARATELYRGILDSYPHDVEATIQYAELLSHLGPAISGTPLEAARDQWQKVLAAEPDNRFAIIHLARIAAALGDTATAALHTTPAGGDAPVGKNRALELAAWRAILLRRPGAEDSVRAALLRAGPVAVANTVWQILTYSRDLDASERFARLFGDASVSPPGGRLLMAYVYAARGRFRAASAALDSAGGELDVYAVIHPAVIGLLPLAPRGRLEVLRRRVAAWQPPPRVPATGTTWETAHFGAEPQVRHYLLGALSAEAGDHEGALRHAAALQRDAVDGAPGAPGLAYTLADELRLRVELATGRPLAERVPGMRRY